MVLSRRVAVVVIILAVATIVKAQPLPSELSSLAKKARLDGRIAAWCRGEFRAGQPRAFAVAITSAAGGGRYLVLDSDATVTELSAFTRGADLSCYSREDAEKLNIAIARSDTIAGQITPRWNTTVVCAFINDTTSVCWQYSTADGAFANVGGWVT